jgi:hypothetical protein
MIRALSVALQRTKIPKRCNWILRLIYGRCIGYDVSVSRVALGFAMKTYVLEIRREGVYFSFQHRVVGA